MKLKKDTLETRFLLFKRMYESKVFGERSGRRKSGGGGEGIVTVEGRVHA